MRSGSESLELVEPTLKIDFYKCFIQKTVKNDKMTIFDVFSIIFFFFLILIFIKVTSLDPSFND
jgi:hypothetical protein